MKAQYRYAVISWCPDLTDPEARSFPAAVLFAGRLGPLNFGAVVGLAKFGGTLDSLSRKLLADVPGLVRRHVEAVIEQSAPANPDALLYSMQNALRNSLHVASVSELMEAEVPNREREQWVANVVVPAGRAVLDADRKGQPTMSADDDGDEFHPYQVWALEQMHREAQAPS
ncbi:MAG: hypothetical protein HY904_11570 [Deltaproteobacteria bacterium]|nr:hypothetical protein [Deltaproteobacteria bacterium]